MTKNKPSGRDLLAELYYLLVDLTTMVRSASGIRTLLMVPRIGYLRETGWWRSLLTRAVVDVEGSPIPWLSLPCVDFLAARHTRNLTLFEYGSGFSTIYYSQHFRSVVSVEHDQYWFNRLREAVPANVTIMLADLENQAEYAQSIATYHPDVIVIDGRHREQCADAVLQHAGLDAVIILDDSQRPRYQSIVTAMTDHGYRALPFWGMAAGSLLRKCTTIFYRPGNCLEI